MRYAHIALAMLATFLLAPAVHGQDVEFTDAVSRQLLVVNASLPEGIDAISRHVLVLNAALPEQPDAVSRQLLVANANLGVEFADADSRAVLLYLPPYDLTDVNQALRLAGGVLAGVKADLDRLNIIASGDSLTKIDMRDVVRILRMAMKLDR